MLTGVFTERKKNGDIYYRASITYKRKHISLGSFSSEKSAHKAYQFANLILYSEPNHLSNPKNPSQPLKRSSSAANPDSLRRIENYSKADCILTFEKWVMIINLKDNGIYCKNAIYLQNRYFIYYLDPYTPLKFDIEDLFYYTSHKIMRRGNHLFVAEYGMQTNILSRFGIRSYSVVNRDYRFVNGDQFDYRYANIEIINRYFGVTRSRLDTKIIYTAKIHVNGDIMIGRYFSEIEAAIAYNKAAAFLRKQGVSKNFQENFIEELNQADYNRIYDHVAITRKIMEYSVHLSI